VAGPADDTLKESLHVQLRCLRRYLGSAVAPLEVPPPGELIGECWIPLNRLYGSKPKGEVGARVLRVHVNEQLWHLGQLIGTVQGAVAVQGRPRLLQRPRGCYTEEGITTSTPLLYRAPISSGDTEKVPDVDLSLLPNQIRKLAALIPKLISLTSPQNKGGPLKRIAQLRIVLDLLKASSKASERSFMYGDERLLREGQRIILQVWRVALSRIEGDEDRDLYHAIIYAAMTRGELDIGGCRFGLMRPTPSADDESFALDYRGILCETLGYVLEKLNHKAVQDKLRLFCSHALVILYFKFPTFQQLLLESVLSEPETKPGLVPEWRDTDFKLEEENSPFAPMPLQEPKRPHQAPSSIELGPRSFSFGSMSLKGIGSPGSSLGAPLVVARSSGQDSEGDRFSSEIVTGFMAGSGGHSGYGSIKSNLSGPTLERGGVKNNGSGSSEEAGWWEQYWSWILQGIKKEDLDEQEPELLKRTSREEYPYWRVRFAKKGHCFNMFLQEWASHVHTRHSGRLQAAPWSGVKGYGTLLKGYLLSIRGHSPDKWSQSTRNCSMALLQNASLIRPLVEILLSATNAHSAPAAMAALELIGDWFAILDKNGTPIDPTFDWALIVKALSVLIMETEHFAVLSASIGFIYNYQHMFAMYARRVVLIELLFDNCFMRLFAHWEAQVRLAFLRLIAIRLLPTKPDGEEAFGAGGFDLSVSAMYEAKLDAVKKQYQHEVKELKGKPGEVGSSLSNSNRNSSVNSFASYDSSEESEGLGTQP